MEARKPGRWGCQVRRRRLGLDRPIDAVLTQTHWIALCALVDPPQDVSAKMRLESAQSASLEFHFRPPASRPDLITKFSFQLTKGDRPIVCRIVTHKVGACWYINAGLCF